MNVGEVPAKVANPPSAESSKPERRIGRPRRRQAGTKYLSATWLWATATPVGCQAVAHPFPASAPGARYPGPAHKEGNRQNDGAMSDTFSIRRATAEDMRVIIGMIDEASAWLATKGTDQWARPWPSR